MDMISLFILEEITDSRLADAPYVTITVKVQDIDNEILDRLKSNLCGLAHMNVKVWRRAGEELPLDEIDFIGLKDAAQIVTTQSS